jgi:hypothetical protein
MASKPRQEATIRRSRRRLIYRAERLAQLDLFKPMEDATQRELLKLKGKIALAARELDLVRQG